MELRVAAARDGAEDEGEAAEWAARLLAELAQVDGLSVERAAVPVPVGAKGAGAALAVILARLGGPDTLRALIGAARAWAARTDRTVEITLDGDVLRLTGASREQQQSAMDSWLARHPVA